MREEARAPLERAIALGAEQLAVNPRDAELLAEVADAHAMLGHAREARALSARAVKLAPDDTEVLQVAAGIDEMFGQRGAALEKLDAGARRGLSPLGDRAQPVVQGTSRRPALRGIAQEGAFARAGKAGRAAAARKALRTKKPGPILMRGGSRRGSSSTRRPERITVSARPSSREGP